MINTLEQQRAYLVEDMKQNWTYNSYSGIYTDQYDFRIIVTAGGYNVYRKDAFCGYYLMLETAKMICNIILNDRILGKAKNV
jgi:hypothetical protein